ncbi:MAG: hypothetical protein ACFE91_03270 [Promethearchaeota archaeon]
MELETLKSLLDISNRKILYNKILNELEQVKSLDLVTYQTYKTAEGIIPLIKISNNSELNDIHHVKIFVGAQHNEYNGLFSMFEFFKLLRVGKINIKKIIRTNQVLYFLPLMNPYGFLNPSKNNKSGYFLKNGLNLNRFWRRTFAPKYKNGMKDLDKLPIPEHVLIVKKMLKKYWDNKEIYIYILDFHETSLLKRFLIELGMNLNLFYKFDHWLKEGIVLNIIKLYEIPYYQKPLFFKCNPSLDHTHLNLSQKQFQMVFEKLQDYVSRNLGNNRLPFYFSYSNKSRNYCQRLASNVYNKLKEKLWETYFPAFSHNFRDHGCFVKMSDATSRPRVYSMSLESEKHFFNIFEEIQKSKSDPNYFNNKLNIIDVSIELALETIKEMINLF